MITFLLSILAALGFVATAYVFVNLGPEGHAVAGSFVIGYLWKTLFLSTLIATTLAFWKLFGRIRSASAIHRK
ncbi:MAG: hypothetical protein ACYC9H_06305 [Sulfuricaulis sp.]